MLLELLVAILSSSAVASIISGVFTIINNRKQKDDGLEAGIRILLYDRIKYLGTEYIKRSKISYEEYEDLLKMHEVYHTALRGNGFLDEIMEQVKHLDRF